MKTKNGLIAAAWLISCGAAFFLGRTIEADPDREVSAEENRKPFVSSRSTASSSRPRGDRRSSLASASSDSGGEARTAWVRQEIQSLKTMSDPIARAQGFLDFVRNLRPDEYLDAVAAFREGGVEEEQFGEYRLLLTAWAQINPLEALDYASGNTGTNLARQTILAAWAKNDTEGAIAWARDNFDNQGDDNRANPWLVGVIEGLAPLDPARATQLLEDLPFSRERGEALSAVFDEISREGPDSAKRWVERLTDERLQAGAASRLAGDLANVDPRGAAEWAASLGPEVMNRAAGEIVERWANQDLTAARSWVESQPTEVVAAAGPKLVDEIIRQKDPLTASDWLANYDGNPQFDDTVRSFVWNSMRQEPSLAADWIMRMTSERDQTRTFHRVLGGWMQRDRQGAMDYIAQNPVPESIKRRAGMTPNQ